MFAAYTELRKAQSVKEYLAKHRLLHHEYLPVKEMGFIYFPLLQKAKVPLAKVVDTKFHFPKKEKTLLVDDLLKGKLTTGELNLLPRSQEIVGRILILEIPPELISKEKLIAEAYLKVHRNIDTVVRKEGIHGGEFRTRTVRILAGKKSKETIHKESGIEMKLHLEKTYFSARSAHERLRIASLVKAGEEVLVMFSGAAPYPLVIARNSPAKMVYGIELNPEAHSFAHENIHLNHLEDKIILYHGDVNKIMPSIKMNFDRIAMPLPRTGEEFLPLALQKVNAGGMIHLYSFLEEKEIPAYRKRVREIALKSGYSVHVVRRVLCGQFSPGTFRVCFDLRVVRKD